MLEVFAVSASNLPDYIEFGRFASDSGKMDLVTANVFHANGSENAQSGRKLRPEAQWLQPFVLAEWLSVRVRQGKGASFEKEEV